MGWDGMAIKDRADNADSAHAAHCSLYELIVIELKSGRPTILCRMANERVNAIHACVIM